MRPDTASSSSPQGAPRDGRAVALMHGAALQTGKGGYTAGSMEEALRQRGLECEVIELSGDDDAVEVAERAALNGASVVIAVGGDGTIHDVAKGLWRATRAGASAALGIVPAGTMNNVAAALGLPEDLDAALDGIAESVRARRYRPLDLAQIGDLTFIEEAGFGILSQLMRIGESVKRNDVSAPAAAVQVGQTLAGYQPAPLMLRLDGRLRWFNALHVVICNAPVIAMRMNVAPGARMDDGLLDVVVYERFRPLELLGYLLRLIGGGRIDDMRVRRYRARTITVEPYGASRATWTVEVDGDPAGDCGPDGRWRRIEVRALPHALRLAAPYAPPSIEEGALKTAQRAIVSTLTPSSGPAPVEPPATAAGQAVREVTEPPQRAARRTALVRTLYLAGGALVVALGFAARRADVLPGDLRITRALQRTRTPGRDRFWRAVAWAGFPRPTALVVALSTLALWLARFRLEAIFFLLATSVNALNFTLKRIVRRHRPANGAVRVHRLIHEPSFPSGHVMFYVSAFGFLVAAALANLRPSALRRSITGLGGSLIALVGASRVYLGAHWPSDVAAGYLVGGLYLGGVLELYTRAKRRQIRETPHTAAPTANELATTPDTDETDETDETGEAGEAGETGAAT